jgi:hypothetical protein
MIRKETSSAFRLSAFIQFLTLLLVGCAGTAAAQNQYTNNTADASLRGSLEVDPSTLGMSFSLPLGNYPGRGQGLPVTLNYSSKVWRMDFLQGWQGYTAYITQLKAKYGEHSLSGWTHSLGVPTIEYAAQPWTLTGEPVCLSCDLADPPAPPYHYIERVLIHLPGGSTHELRKSDTPVNSDMNGTAPPLAGTYYAVDGSQMRLVVDTSASPVTSMLWLPDGSRYWLDSPEGVRYYDRHGNTLIHHTATQKWTDTLGREISLPPTNNQQPGDYTYALPGAGGTPAYFTLRWRLLADARTNPAQPLRFKGNLGTEPVNPSQKSPYLFSGGSLERVVDGSSAEFNPWCSGRSNCRTSCRARTRLLTPSPITSGPKLTRWRCRQAAMNDMNTLRLNLFQERWRAITNSAIAAS